MVENLRGRLTALGKNEQVRLLLEGLPIALNLFLPFSEKLRRFNNLQASTKPEEPEVEVEPARSVEKNQVP